MNSESKEENFFSGLQPLLKFSKFFGIEIFNFSCQTGSNGSTILVMRRSIKATVFTVTGIFSKITTYLFLIHLTSLYYTESENNGPTFHVCILINFTAVLAASLAGTLGMCVNSNPRRELLQAFLDVDEKLLMHRKDSYRRWSTRLTLGLSLMCLTLVVVSGYKFSIMRSFVAATVADVVSCCLMHLPVFLTAANYVNLTLLVHQRLNLLNKKLQNICDVKVMRVFCTDLMLVNNMGVSMALPQQVGSPGLRNSAVNLIGPATLPDHFHSECVREISSARRLYNKLYRIVCLINKTYGTLILFCMLTSFTAITYSVYFLLEITFRISVFDYRTFGLPRAVSELAWSLLYFSQAMAIIYVCSITTKRSRITMNIIQNLLLKPDIDKATVNLLRMFSHQVSNTDMKFSAAGFFTLDLPLLTSLMTSVTSYVLVLLQFDSVENES